MVKNLQRAGHEVWVYNRTREKAKALVADGARIANTPGEATRFCEAMFTMLSDDGAAEEVVFGADGIAHSLGRDAVHISSSTISVAFSKKLENEHRARGQGYVSAPVFGRPEAAESKQLIVVAGGEITSVERVLPLFGAIGRRTFIAGTEPWHANAMKLCGNFMIASMIETFSEALVALRKANADTNLFLEAMNELFASPVYKNYGSVINSRKFEPAGFALKLGLKDVRQVLEFAQELPAPMPLASLVRDRFLSAMANGQEEMDWSSLERVAARSAGVAN